VKPTAEKGELVITYEKIGDLWLRVGKPDSALRAYESAVPLLQRLTEIAPYRNRSWQSDLAGIQARIEKAKQALRDSRGATGDAPAKGIVDEHG
jgi:tetratricopeptide (TPR) repeat protein